MNILIITSFLPYPLSSGGAQAQFNMIERLRDKHHIAVLFPINEKNGKDAQQTLAKLWPDVSFYGYPYWKQLISPSFFFAKAKRAIDLKSRPKSPRLLVERTLRPYGFPDNQRFHNYVRKVLKDFAVDLIQIDFFPFLHLVQSLPHDIPRIFIHHEIRYVRNTRLLANVQLTSKEAQLMEDVKNQEINDLNQYSSVVTLTDVDKQELKENGVKVPIYVSPAAINSPVLPYSNWNHRILFIGGYAHTPNKEGLDWFFSEVAPKIDWGKTECTGMDVIGSGWPANYADHFELNGLSVTFHGFIPVIADIARGAILIIPILSGSGMRMKILEGAAQSMPMLTTTIGVEGLDFENGESIIIEDTPSSFATALVRLMNNKNLREGLAIQANKKFQESYSADALARIRENIYKTVVSK